MAGLKHITTVLIMAAAMAGAASPQKPVTVLLQEGLYAEQITGDLDAAIEIYEQIIDASRQTHHAAAQAVYRIGMCHLKKGDKAAAARQFEAIASDYADQKELTAKARAELVKIKPPVAAGKPLPARELVDSGRVPMLKAWIEDNVALDLEMGALFGPGKSRKETSEDFDVAWDNDGGGVLMVVHASKVRMMALTGAKDWEQAISAARVTHSLLQKSTTRGVFGNESKFVAVLTNVGNLAVIEIVKYSRDEGTLAWWLEAPTVPVFGPTETITLNDVDHRHPKAKGEFCIIDFDTGGISKLSEEARELSGNDSVRWVIDRGGDAVAEIPGLIGTGLAIEKLSGDSWDDIRPSDVRAILGKAAPSVEDLPGLAMDEDDKGALYAFKTLQGGLGIAQVLESDKEAQTVRFRYAMLRNISADEHARSQSASIRRHSATRLKTLVFAMMRFANEHDSKFPDAVPAMRAYIEKEEDFEWACANVEYLGKGEKITSKNLAVRPLAFDKTMLGAGEGTNVLFGDGHIEYKTLDELQYLGIAILRDVFIPDADTMKGIVLDLASGELLDAGEGGDEQIIGRFTKIGKGDLAWDRVLIVLRNAKVAKIDQGRTVPLEPMEGKGDAAAYEIEELPAKLLVTTAEGAKYRVTVKTADDRGINVSYLRIADSTQE